MEVRSAGPDDTTEVVRLARMMFDALGIEGADTRWEEQPAVRFRRGLADGTVAAFVVDRPSGIHLYHELGFRPGPHPELRLRLDA